MANQGNPLAIWRWPLHWQILLGLVVGAVLGGISAWVALSAAGSAGDPKLAESIVVARWDFLIYSLIGDMFIQGLKLIIVPIVTSSIILAVSQIGGGGALSNASPRFT